MGPITPRPGRNLPRSPARERGSWPQGLVPAMPERRAGRQIGAADGRSERGHVRVREALRVVGRHDGSPPRPGESPGAGRKWPGSVATRELERSGDADWGSRARAGDVRRGGAVGER
jgi:hypothetical protein